MAVNQGCIINGERFVAVSHMTESKTEEVKRTWTERLFTLPWRPLKTHKFVTTQVASRQVVRVDNKFFAHPDLIAEIAAAFEKESA